MSKGKLHVLPDSLVDKIAAGEVVERPASVVKELLENALDAKADFVEISIKKGGKEFVSIRDNGIGMTPEELKLAIQRHATSKISSIDDLDSIVTYGFRGEALPSIGSVSRFRISSKTKDMDLAYWIEIKNSLIKSDGYESMATGTKIEVKNLFFNVPARLKFLKKDATEQAHIQDTIIRLAMVRPDVRFKFVADGKTLLDLPRHNDRLSRAKTLLKRRVGDQLYDFINKQQGYKVEVILSPPHLTVSDTSGIYLFVNDRYVKDRFLLSTLISSYGGMLERRRYPISIMFLSVPTGVMDVNVHPQKLEVRFREERRVASIIRNTVSEALAMSPWALGGVRSKESSVSFIPEDNDPKTRIKTSLNESFQFHSSSKMQNLKGSNTLPIKRYRIKPHESKPVDFLKETIDKKPIITSNYKNKFNSDAPYQNNKGLSYTISKDKTLPLIESVQARFIGQLHGLYLLFETPKGLMVMDQHAAHERIRYVKILEQMQKSQVIKQRFLFPERVRLTLSEKSFLIENPIDWEKIGFEIELFGEEELMVRAIPTQLEGAKVQDLVHDVLSALMTGGSGLDSDTIDHLAATMACHGAIRAGDFINENQALLLLSEIQKTESGGHCPHGRPVWFTLSIKELEQRFKRS